MMGFFSCLFEHKRLCSPTKFYLWPHFYHNLEFEKSLTMKIRIFGVLLSGKVAPGSKFKVLSYSFLNSFSAKRNHEIRVILMGSTQGRLCIQVRSWEASGGPVLRTCLGPIVQEEIREGFIASVWARCGADHYSLMRWIGVSIFHALYSKHTEWLQ
jgi:hypothetical protein